MLNIKKIYIIILLLLTSNCKSPSLLDLHHTNKKIIHAFLSELYDNTISPNEIVKKHLEYSLIKNDGGVIGYDLAIKHIIWIRSDTNHDNGWLLPKHKVAGLKVKHVVPFKGHEHLNKLSFIYDKLDKKRMYVLLNEEKNEILQYFLLRNNKIMAFTLFVKPGQAYFFSYK